jgi:ATP-dependent DNA helicase
MVIRESEFLSKINWKVLIVDEGHRLKNQSAILYTTLMEDFKISFKLLLTGSFVFFNSKGLRFKII